VAAESADAILVAPATARWLGAMAAGLADDVITATCLASRAPVVVCPAMDGDMWSHPATQANVEKLRGFGYTIVEPEVGPLASGQRGVGRLAETPAILAALEKVLDGKQIRKPDPGERPPVVMPLPANDLKGWRVVITAGGTAEPIDPVRFIGNRSTGKMGVAIAQAALDRGAQVTLIAGMTSAPLPSGVNLVRAPSAAEMRDAVLAALPGVDALVMAAAVADFRPRTTSQTKIARDGAGLTLELEPTQDILAEAAAQARATAGVRPLIVGFAAETGSLERAPQKAARKGVDLMVANDVAMDGSGFGTETNQVTVIEPGGSTEEWPMMSKRQVADRLLDRLIGLRAAKSAELAAR
jgi:phosphopantothenoylcysteine decarboxylase/phosphopantothenate--cysteine ligase